jgi:integration host factor subunit beta
MTKAELVEDVAEAAELTKKDAERLVEIVFESIIDTLNQGEKIELRGFGSFRVRERGARRGRNPKTGDPVDIPAKRVPYFKPGKELKELINESTAAGGGSSAATGGGTNTITHPTAATSNVSTTNEMPNPETATATAETSTVSASEGGVSGSNVTGDEGDGSNAPNL